MKRKYNCTVCILEKKYKATKNVCWRLCDKHEEEYKKIMNGKNHVQK